MPYFLLHRPPYRQLPLCLGFFFFWLVLLAFLLDEREQHGAGDGSSLLLIVSNSPALRQQQQVRRPHGTLPGSPIGTSTKSPTYCSGGSLGCAYTPLPRLAVSIACCCCCRCRCRRPRRILLAVWGAERHARGTYIWVRSDYASVVVGTSKAARVCCGDVFQALLC